MSQVAIQIGKTLRRSRLALFPYCLGIAILSVLGGCSPPDQKLVESCRQTAAVRGRGYHLTPSDLSELVEECMSKKGYSLRENSQSCTDNLATAVDRRCYYPDTMLGHFYERLAGS
jgi:hypothetical protein